MDRTGVPSLRQSALVQKNRGLRICACANIQKIHRTVTGRMRPWEQ